MNIQGAGLDLIRNPDKFYDWIGLKQSPGTASTKTTQAAKTPFVQKPKTEKDPFLEGFYSVADKPEDESSYTSPLAKSRAILDSMTQTKREEEDDFLKGFYSVADRPKEETPTSAYLQTIRQNMQTPYKPGDWIRSTMAQPNLWNAKNTDLSPQKVNYASNQNTRTGESRDEYDSRVRNQYAARRQAEEDATRERLQAIWNDMQANYKPGDWMRSTVNNLPYANPYLPKEKTFQESMNEFEDKLDHIPQPEIPFEHTQYDYRDRIYARQQNRYKSGNVIDNKIILREPLGRFGIAEYNSDPIKNVNGKPTVDYLIGLNTRYPDADGVLRQSEIPQWVFNRDAIKQHNIQRIDQAAEMLSLLAGKKQKAAINSMADNLKTAQGARVDMRVKKIEDKINAVDPTSRKNRINTAFGDIAENMPQILKSDAMKYIKKGGKAVSVLGDALAVANMGMTAWDDYQDDGRIGKDTGKAVAGLAGDLAGSALGAKIGAAVFGAIGGAASGGVLAAPLAILGGVIGGYIGGIIGDDIAEDVFELIV